MIRPFRPQYGPSVANQSYEGPDAVVSPAANLYPGTWLKWPCEVIPEEVASRMHEERLGQVAGTFGFFVLCGDGEDDEGEDDDKVSCESHPLEEGIHCRMRNERSGKRVSG